MSITSISQPTTEQKIAFLKSKGWFVYFLGEVEAEQLSSNWMTHVASGWYVGVQNSDGGKYDHWFGHEDGEEASPDEASAWQVAIEDDYPELTCRDSRQALVSYDLAQESDQ